MTKMASGIPIAFALTLLVVLVSPDSLVAQTSATPSLAIPRETRRAPALPRHTTVRRAAVTTAAEAERSQASTELELVDELGRVEPDAASEDAEAASQPASALDGWLSAVNGGSLRLVLLLGLVSLAPAALLMTTSYVRIVVVLSLLKQALGNQQAFPAQATTALALFMTALVMTPVWQRVYSEAVAPYQAEGSEMSAVDAWQSGVRPVRRFMSQQIDHADNSEDVWLFFRYLPQEQQSQPPETYDDVPLQVLLPAFLLSELKTAFLIGFQIYLPFLVLDFVVAPVTTSMGLNMMQPATVSFPFKLLLFVLVDGWRLVAGTLLDSFAAWQ